MASNSGLFHYDHRNIGGRQKIIENVRIHQARLQAVQKMKSTISSPPSTYHLVSHLSKARQLKMQNTKLEQENKSLHENMMAKIERERKARKLEEKERMERLMRPKTAGKKGATLAVILKEASANTSKRPKSAMSAPGSSSMRRSVSSASVRDRTQPRPNEANEMGNLDDSMHSMESLEHKLDEFALHSTDDASASVAAPKLRGSSSLSGDSDSPDEYDLVKSKLMDLIVQHRIFRESNIMKLFEQTRQIYSNLDSMRLESVLKELAIGLSIPGGRTRPENERERVERERNERKDKEKERAEDAKYQREKEEKERERDRRHSRSRSRSPSRSRSRSKSPRRK